MDERALGEANLRRLRTLLASLKEKPKDWKNPKRAREEIALAKALYASRQITRSQYVFYIVTPVEAVHEARWLDNAYQTALEPISAALRQIERDYGLGPDQYWARKDAPKEYQRLNRKYEAILLEKFKATLKEFDLDDILALLVRSKEEFDELRERGRRSVFHDKEYALAVRDAVIQHESDAERAAKAHAFSAAVTSLGAGVEGILLLRCLRSPQKAASVSKALPRRIRPRLSNDPGQWTFETLIETCLAAGWFQRVESVIAQYSMASMAHVLRHMRNYVHPGKYARERPWSIVDEQEYLDARALYSLLLSTLGRVLVKQPNSAPGREQA